jgi:Williams-Beuren syndrome DDT (WSD), D-TOX E motif
LQTSFIQQVLSEEADDIGKHRILAKLMIRLQPIGEDRNARRYWLVNRDANWGTDSGCVMVESSDNNSWYIYDTISSLVELFKWLDPHGIRESRLRKASSAINAYLYSYITCVDTACQMYICYMRVFFGLIVAVYLL